MNVDLKLIIEIATLLLLSLPPFLYFYKYIHNHVKVAAFKVILFLGYWVGTLMLSTLIPVITVAFLIWSWGRNNLSQGMTVLDDKHEYNRLKISSSDIGWKFSLKVFAGTALWGIMTKFVITYINNIVVIIMTSYNIGLKSQEIVNDFLISSLPKSILYFILAVICAPLIEEFVFRFWVFDRLLKRRMNSYLAALFSSLLFMSVHFNIQGAVAFFLVGLVNCYLYEKKGYWAAVANHFIFNFTSIMALILIRILNVQV